MRIRAAVMAAFAVTACSAVPAPSPSGGTSIETAERGRPDVDAGAQSPADRLPAGGAPKDPLRPEQIWSVDREDNVTHVLSGASCPAVLGPLRRGRQIIYRPNGMDVGCSYTSGDGKTLLRMYIFTSENGGLEAEMRIASDSMRAQQPVGRRVTLSEGARTFSGFALAGPDGAGTATRNTVLMTQTRDGWLVKVRLTCPESEAGPAENMAAGLLAGTAQKIRASELRQR